MINEKSSQLLNEQIGNEFSAFLQYVAVSTWFDAQALPVLSAYFAKQADEERQHAMKMIQYLNDTGQAVDIPSIDKPKNTFESVEEAVLLAYDQEVEVTRQIEKIYGVAVDEKDHLTKNFLQWFLEEQVEEVASMDSLLMITRRAGDNLFRIEEYLSRSGHPEDGA